MEMCTDRPERERNQPSNPPPPVVISSSAGERRRRLSPGRRCTRATRCPASTLARINSRGYHVPGKTVPAAAHSIKRGDFPSEGKNTFHKNHCSLSPLLAAGHLNQSVARLHTTQSLLLVLLQVTSTSVSTSICFWIFFSIITFLCRTATNFPPEGMAKEFLL